MIKEPGKKEVRIIEAQTKQEKLTDAQINDIPKNASDRTKNIIIGVLLLIVAIQTLILTTRCKT